MMNRTVITTLTFIVLLIILPLELMSKKAVAIIVGGNEKCKVTRIDNGIKKILDAKLYMKLYQGDRIFKWENIKSLKLDFGPFAKSKIENKSTLIIVVEPPKNKESVFSKISDFLDLEKTKFKEFKGATRDEIIEGPSPFENATLIADQKIFFSNYFKGKTVVFKDLEGKYICHKTLRDDLVLTPGKIGLVHGKTYIWEIRRGETLHYRSLIRLLDKDDVDVVKKSMGIIDSEEICDEARIIRKAAYFQMLSDLYPDQVDLYWSSYYILNNAVFNEDEYIDLHDMLMERCIDHFKGGIFGTDFAILDTPGCLITVELKREGKKKFVAPDNIFLADDVYSLHFQTNFKGYAVILYESKDKLELTFPSESIKYRVQPKSGYRSCYYRFGKKRSIETYLFILSKGPIKEMKRFMKLSRDKWKGGKELNSQQRKQLVKLIKRVEKIGQKVDLKLMGTKVFVKTSFRDFSGIIYFKVSLENYGE